jgi:hypothetical protein
VETSDQADIAASHVSNLTAAPLAPLICTNCKLPQTESAAATLSWLCPCPSSCSCIPGHTPSSYAHTNKDQNSQVSRSGENISVLWNKNAVLERGRGTMERKRA